MSDKFHANVPTVVEWPKTKRNYGISIGENVIGSTITAGDGNSIRYSDVGNEIDIKNLSMELSKLVKTIRPMAVDPAQDKAIVHIRAAETAARHEDNIQVFEQLAMAGRWPLDMAEKIGATVAVEAIRIALKLT